MVFQLDNMGQVMFKQIKNRDNDVSKYKRFVVGVDREACCLLKERVLRRRQGRQGRRGR